ncbi:MAG: hypothetical protein ABIE74_11420, partial [Pseudomonadota bacterium]
MGTGPNPTVDNRLKVFQPLTNSDLIAVKIQNPNIVLLPGPAISFCRKTFSLSPRHEDSLCGTHSNDFYVQVLVRRHESISLYKNSSIERLFNNPLLKKYLKQVPEKIAKVAINYVLKKAGLGRSSTKLISSGIIGSGKVVYYIVEGSKEKVYNISTVEKMLRGGVA